MFEIKACTVSEKRQPAGEAGSLRLYMSFSETSLPTGQAA